MIKSETWGKSGIRGNCPLKSEIKENDLASTSLLYNAHGERKLQEYRTMEKFTQIEVGTTRSEKLWFVFIQTFLMLPRRHFELKFRGTFLFLDEIPFSILKFLGDWHTAGDLWHFARITPYFDTALGELKRFWHFKIPLVCDVRSTSKIFDTRRCNI